MPSRQLSGMLSGQRCSFGLPVVLSILVFPSSSSVSEPMSPKPVMISSWGISSPSDDDENPAPNVPGGGGGLDALDGGASDSPSVVVSPRPITPPGVGGLGGLRARGADGGASDSASVVVSPAPKNPASLTGVGFGRSGAGAGVRPRSASVSVSDVSDMPNFMIARRFDCRGAARSRDTFRLLYFCFGFPFYVFLLSKTINVHKSHL